MSGLGDALQNVGGQLFSMAKEQRLEKLEKDREERAEAREKAREERQQLRELNKVKQTRTIQRDGQWFEQQLNSEGRVLDERTADPYAVTQMEQESQKGKITLENLINQSELNKKKLRDYDADRALDVRFREAQIGSENRQYTPEAYRRGSIEESVSTGNVYDAADQLLKDTADLKKQYTGGDDPILTAEQYRNVVTEATIAAAQRGIDARAFLSQALKRYVNDPRNKK